MSIRVIYDIFLSDIFTFLFSILMSKFSPLNREKTFHVTIRLSVSFVHHLLPPLPHAEFSPLIPLPQRIGASLFRNKGNVRVENHYESVLFSQLALFDSKYKNIVFVR